MRKRLSREQLLDGARSLASHIGPPGKIQIFEPSLTNSLWEAECATEHSSTSMSDGEVVIRALILAALQEDNEQPVAAGSHDGMQPETHRCPDCDKLDTYKPVPQQKGFVCKCGEWFARFPS